MPRYKNPLTPLQERFCQEYIVDLNANKAAERAGYSKNTSKNTGHRALSYPRVQARIAELQAEIAKESKLTAKYVLDGLMEIHQRCMQQVEVRDREGNPTGEWTFDATNANRALENLGKHLKLFVDRHEHTGSIVVEITETDAKL